MKGERNREIWKKNVNEEIMKGVHKELRERIMIGRNRDSIRKDKR